MKKGKKLTALLLSAIMLLSLLAGCGQASTGSPSSDASGSSSSAVSQASSQDSSTESVSSEASKAEKYPLTFTDSLGTEFTLEEPLQSIVVLNRQTAEAIKILGAEDKVIATGDTTIENNSYLGYNELPDMGETSELNIEAIIGLKPDAVFIHTNRANDVLEEKLNPLGIKVIRIDNYQPERYEEELTKLGLILDKEDQAAEFLEYRASVEAIVADRIKDLPEADRKKVMALSVGFINSNGGYRVFPAMANNGEMGVGEGYATILAGGIDATPEIQWDPAQGDTTIQVEEEYALSANPDVITLHGTWLGGYNCTDINEFKTVIDNIYDISSINKMKAGETKDVYVFHTDMLGAGKRHIGLLQLAKYLYPEKFSDVDVDTYAAEYFEDWLGVPYEGIWFYSAKDNA